MKLNTVSPRFQLKLKENEIDKEELRQTLEQVKLLKIKTNQRILDYERTNEEQRRQIESLNERLSQEILEKEELRLQNQDSNELRSKLQGLMQSLTETQRQLQQKTFLVDFLRKETEEFQKKYYSSKDQLEQKMEEIQRMKEEKESYEAKVDRINCLLGTRTISDLEEFSFLENSNLVTYLEIERSSKIQIQMNVGVLNNELMEKNHILEELKEEANQLKELLELANNKNQILIETDKSSRSLANDLKLQVSSKALQISKCHQESFLLKSSILSFGQEIERQKQMIKQFTFKEEEDEKEAELHREYNLLIDQVMNDKEEFSIVNSEIETLHIFKAEHRNNIDKLKFLCEQIDTS